MALRYINPWGQRHLTRQISSFTGNKGRIEYPIFGSAEVLLETDDKSLQRFDFDLPQHIQQPLIHTIVDERLGTGHCPSTGMTAAHTNWVMEQNCN